MLKIRIKTPAKVRVETVHAADADRDGVLLRKHPAVTPARRAEIEFDAVALLRQPVARHFRLQGKSDGRGIERLPKQGFGNDAVDAVGADQKTEGDLLARPQRDRFPFDVDFADRFAKHERRARFPRQSEKVMIEVEPHHEMDLGAALIGSDETSIRKE